MSPRPSRLGRQAGLNERRPVAVYGLEGGARPRPSPEPEPSNKERVTIATIARESGLSVATVSKVLNGRPDVSASTHAHYSS